MTAQPTNMYARAWWPQYDGTGLADPDLRDAVGTCVEAFSRKAPEPRAIPTETAGTVAAEIMAAGAHAPTAPDCGSSQSWRRNEGKRTMGNASHNSDSGRAPAPPRIADAVDLKQCAHPPKLRVVTPKGKTRAPRRSGGYRSARISSAGTPDAASAASTRLEGTTPERRHFCTAWYLTPQASAKGCSPPAPEMSRSTTFDASTASHMPRILQPTVVDGKQPFRAFDATTMQFMVVPRKEAAKREFSKNLNAALDVAGAPQRGRPAWLRARLGGAAVISQESCRKWLKGLDLPDQQNMSILATTLKLNVQQLLTGCWEPAPGSQDEDFAAILNVWPTLSPSQRKSLRTLIEGLRGEQVATQLPTHPARRRA